MGKNELAWLAGFWDGEGSTGLIKNKKTRTLVCQLSHTEIDSVRNILRILRENGVAGRGYTYQERDPLRHRDAHYIRVSGLPNVLKMARLLRPFAVTKRRHWEIAIEWAMARIKLAGGIDAKGHLFRGGIGGKRGYSERELELEREMSKLNRRGPEDRAERKTKEGRITDGI